MLLTWTMEVQFLRATLMYDNHISPNKCRDCGRLNCEGGAACTVACESRPEFDLDRDDHAFPYGMSHEVDEYDETNRRKGPKSGR